MIRFLSSSFPFFLFLFLTFYFSVIVNFLGSQPCMRRTRNQAVFIPEIERFLHRRRRAAQNNTAMANRTLKEYATPSMAEPQAVIVYPTVEDDNFEIKPALLNLAQQNQFLGSPTEDPNLHISVFLRIRWNHEGEPRSRKTSSLSLFLKG